MTPAQGTPNAIGGPSAEESDVPKSTGENVGGLILAGQNKVYKQGGEVKTCKMTSHEKSKSSPNW